LTARAENTRMNMWSARKAAVQAEAEAETRALESAIAEREQATRDAENAEKTDAEILADLELQDPDTMVAGDDFSAFLKSAVPEHLRRRALRRLWVSDPALANLDNLLDYGDDFLAESKLGLAVKTAYQVGKGMLSHIEEMERQAAETDLPDATMADLEAEEGPDAAALATTTAESDVNSENPEERDHIKDTATNTITLGTEKNCEITDNQTPPMALTKRRMRFAFADEQGTGTRQL